jgi:hypothetical protein
MAQKPIFVPREWEAVANLRPGMFIFMPESDFDDIREVASVIVVNGKWIVTFVDGTAKRFPSFGRAMTFVPID